MIFNLTPWKVGSGSIAIVTLLLAVPRFLVFSSLAAAFISPIGAVSPSARTSAAFAGSTRSSKFVSEGYTMARDEPGSLLATISSTASGCGADMLPDGVLPERDLLDDSNLGMRDDRLGGGDDALRANGLEAIDPQPPSQETKLIHVDEVEAPNIWNLPNVLTMARVVAVPVFAAVFYAPSPMRNVWCAAIFALAALTDWLDGFLARKLGVESPFGAFLDPVADKLMVSTALILLSERLGSWVTVCAAVVLCRELAVSALREWMAQLGLRDKVKVGNAGKWKTATQMVAITLLLLLEPGAKVTILPMSFFMPLAKNLLYISTVLTITSGSGYLRAAWPALSGRE